MGSIVRKNTLVVLLAFFILSLVLTYPLPLHVGSAVEDRQDALLNVWITAWDGHQLLTDPPHLFDANIFYPYPRTLAYSELLLGNALLALPLTAVTGNPVLGYNATLLLSFCLSALGAYLLSVRLTRSRGAGVVAGLVFAFSSYRMTNLAQAQLLTTQWMPFALLALHELLHRSRARHGVLFVLFFSLQALSSFYYGILLALAALVYGLWSVVIDRRRPRTLLLLAIVGIALVLLPFALPYFRVQEEMGFERTLADSEPFSASLQQYLMVPAGSLLHARWLPSDDVPIAGGYPMDALFPGVATLALAGVGLLWGRGSQRGYFALLALAAALLSLGPRLYLAPGQAAGLDMALPYAWLYALVPGFEAMRAPVRFDALVSLALAVLASYGVAALPGRRKTAPGGGPRGRKPAAGQASLPSAARRTPPPGTRGRMVGAALLAGLVLLESFVWPGATAEPVPVGAEVPRVIRWLAGEATGDPSPAKGPILELPMAFTAGGPQLEYQYLSIYHWRTTPDGYSGFIPPKHGQIVYEMERFPAERSVSLLQALGVRMVVVHTDCYPPDRWREMEAALDEAKDLSLLAVLGADRAYEVQSQDFTPTDLKVYAYLPPRAQAGASYTAYAVALNEGGRSYALQPTEEMEVTVRWQGEGGQVVESGQVTVAVPLVTSPDGGAAIVPLSLVAPEASGRYQLSLMAAGGPLGPWVWEGRVEAGGEGDATFPVPARLARWTVPAEAEAGTLLQVKLTWLPLGKIDAYYSVYVKLLDAEGRSVASWDGQPQEGQAPTLFWRPGETVEDTVTLSLPAAPPPGEYQLVAGMYRARDLARCLTLDEEGQPVAEVVLGTVRVGP
jgi:hypothetical protein